MMRYNALGLLETYGYTAAITALDTALKTANVTLKDFKTVGGGLVTMMIEGDVAAVQAAIEAASAAAATVGSVISQHVISRPDIQLKLLFQEFSPGNQAAIEVVEEERVQKEPKDSVIHLHGKEMKIMSKKDLYRMKVVDLRKVARGLTDFSMEAQKIKFANKAELVDAILNYLKMEVR
ncbi:microcompartments protein [Clostridium aceticum]|uniref:Microcompartments protein n=1 Tax=Clostridium aceticum TaxID=84022 RepID=A0A0G3W7N0_9CLOT|nr:BMC domain-containing protein [Clostridium aceticum]AKL93917.1 microcompartments protein [Clostridium aceticum]